MPCSCWFLVCQESDETSVSWAQGTWREVAEGSILLRKFQKTRTENNTNKELLYAVNVSWVSVFQEVRERSLPACATKTFRRERVYIVFVFVCALRHARTHLASLPLLHRCWTNTYRSIPSLKPTRRVRTSSWARSGSL